MNRTAEITIRDNAPAEATFRDDIGSEAYWIRIEYDMDDERGPWSVNDSSDADPTWHPTFADALHEFLKSVASQVRSMEDEDA